MGRAAISIVSISLLLVPNILTYSASYMCYGNNFHSDPTTFVYWYCGAFQCHKEMLPNLTRCCQATGWSHFDFGQETGSS